MKPFRPQVQLVDDPVTQTLWILKHLSLETAASYLALLYAYANAHQPLSESDTARISALLEQLLSDTHHRAA